MNRCLCRAVFAQAVRWLLVLTLAGPATRAFANFPSANDGFDPNANGNVFAAVTQPDGKVIIAGGFTLLQPNGAVAPTGRNRIARLFPDGGVDPAFDPNANAQINAVALQPDGKILIGGLFSSLQPNGAAAPIARSRIARLNADGSLDASFDPNAGGPIPAGVSVDVITVQADGKILIGGGFTTLQPNGAATPVTRRRIARLNPDGSLDASFNPNANNYVFAITVQPDGKILIGGGFTTLQPNGATAATERHRIARLHPDGTIDEGFDPKADNTVLSIALEVDHSILIGGSFSTLRPNGAESATERSRIARLRADGTVDTAFDPGAGGNVSVIRVQPDGRILLGGNFNSLRPNGITSIERSALARLHRDGTVDTAFAPNANGPVSTLALLADGSVVAGGYFTQLTPLGATSAAKRNRVARINLHGGVDRALDPAAGASFLAMARQGDGKLIVTGLFTSVGGVARNYLARLNADGTLDLSFNPNPDGRVSAVLVQPDGKIVIGGAFTKIGDDTRAFIARLNPDGSLDNSFDPKPDAPVHVLAGQTDGDILLGGDFSLLQPNNAETATARTGLARVNSDGTLDTGFNPTPNSSVLALAVQSDGKVILGGAFTALRPNDAATSTSRSFLARVNSDGTLDADFHPEPNNLVRAIAIQGDGKIVIGGSFTQVWPDPDDTFFTRNRIARLLPGGGLDLDFISEASGIVRTVVLLPEGKILLGGDFLEVNQTSRSYVARLKADGTLDLPFDPHADNAVNAALAADSGAVLVAGSFTQFQPHGGTIVGAHGIARLTSAGLVDTAFRGGTFDSVSGRVQAVALQPDGGIIAGGAFAHFSGVASENLVRLNADGRTDATFKPSPNGPVNAILVLPTSSEGNPRSSRLAWLNPDGTLRRDLNPQTQVTITGQIHALAEQADGKIVAGGRFVLGGGVESNSLVRFNPDGSLDTSFLPAPDTTVNAIAIQPDGKIIVGGTFTAVPSAVRNRLARFASDGTLDTTFDPNANGTVNAIVIQSDGKIIVGGSFTTLQPNGAASSTTRNNLARLNADGTLDTDYNPNPNGVVYALALQGDGKVIVGGAFTSVQPTNASTTERNRIARLNTDGSLDNNFDPDANGDVRAVVVQADAKILLGGAFTELAPNGATVSTTRNRIARVHFDGTLDLDFVSSLNGAVRSLAAQPDGKTLVGGEFTEIDGVPRLFAARLNSDSSLDLGFNPSANGAIYAVLLRSDQSIVLGGAFTSLRADGGILIGGSFTTTGSGIAQTRNLARLDPDGSPDPSYDPRPNGPVHALLREPGGRVLVAGAFGEIAGQSRRNLARLDGTGQVDAAFAPTANEAVTALALQADGRVLIGGNFTEVSGVPRSRLARLATDGAVDSGFNPGANGAIHALAVQSDGRIVVAGAFTTIAGSPRSHLARLQADGTLDASFAPAIDATVHSLAVQADGSLLIGGAFTLVSGTSRPHTARLRADGSLDPNYNPAPNGEVATVVVQPDGKILLGGVFDQVGGLGRFLLARLGSAVVSSQTLVASNDRTSLTWSREGAAPLLTAALFDFSRDASSWQALGEVGRPNEAGQWRLSGLSLPTDTPIYLRARGIVPSTEGGSSGVIEWVTLVPSSSASAGINSASELRGTEGNAFHSALSAPGAPVRYQASGLPPGLSIDETTGVITGTPRQRGTYFVTLTITHADGSVSVSTLVITIDGASAYAAFTAIEERLAAFSARAVVTDESDVVVAFTLAGSGEKSVLLRAAGPSLTRYGVEGALQAPTLELRDANGALLLRQENWSAELATTFSRLGAFPFANDSLDAAAVTILAPGTYALHVRDRSELGGATLGEIYDAANEPAAEGVRIKSVSLRANLAGADALVGGFTITGQHPVRLLVRGLGSGGIDPMVRIYDHGGRLIAGNDNWETAVSVGANDVNTHAADLNALAAGAGVSALVTGSKDAALVAELAPGTYTVQVLANSAAHGPAKLELHELR